MNDVDTSKVSGRRVLRFESLEDISAEVERLAAAKNIKTLGNWSAGQVFQHLAIVMHGAIDGMQIKLPLTMRIMIPVMLLFAKQKFLNQRMKSGVQLPKAAMAALVPPPTSWDDGLASIRSGLTRLQANPKLARHPFLGDLSTEEWTKVQCRHCELHLSFLETESSTLAEANL